MKGKREGGICRCDNVFKLQHSSHQIGSDGDGDWDVGRDGRGPEVDPVRVRGLLHVPQQLDALLAAGSEAEDAETGEAGPLLRLSFLLHGGGEHRRGEEEGGESQQGEDV